MSPFRIFLESIKDLQAKLYGALDRETIRFLDRIAHEQQGRKLRGGKVKGIPPAPRQRSLKPGAILVREHEGELHRVTVIKDGFAWNGGAYCSLSQVARAITGTNWNAPRFNARAKCPVYVSGKRGLSTQTLLNRLGICQIARLLRQKWSRGQVETRLANLPPCLIGMEACVGAHHLSRKLMALGHDAAADAGKVCAALLEGPEERLPRRGGDR